jgi:catechol 2,3-dioxygenase-like lactoylglutathione lyase family enzyme
MIDPNMPATPDGRSMLSRRSVLTGIGLAALVPLIPGVSRAETTEPASTAPAASQLPLKTTGLEHMGTVVPDVTAAAKFYGRLFNPELYKEQDPPLRYYVTLGVGYLALGTRANQPHAFFDHFCALVQDYDAPAMAQQLKAENLPAGRYGIIPDPDGVGFQLLGTPGGLAKTTEPAGRIVEGDALVRPVRLDHVVLHVSDLEQSLGFYRRFFGPEAAHAHDPKQASFQVAGTRLVLEAATAGEAAKIDRICVKVQPFDRKAVSRGLTALGAQVATDSRQGLRFTDPFGLVMELQANT